MNKAFPRIGPVVIGVLLYEMLVGRRSFLGETAAEVIDNSDGKAATAKNPRKWPHLFDFRATFAEPVEAKIPPVRISLPDGRTVTSDQADLNEILSKALSRDVTFRDLAFRAAQTGTFFDGAMIHLVTTATLDHLRELYPQGHFDPRRFRISWWRSPQAKRALPRMRGLAAGLRSACRCDSTSRGYAGAAS